VHRVSQLLEERGFTGTRCAFTSCQSLNAYTKSGEAKPLHPCERRMRQNSRRELHRPARAEALYHPKQSAGGDLIKHYLGNAEVLRKGAKKPDESIRRRERAVYLVRTPKGVTSGRRSTRFWRTRTWSSRRQRFRLEGRGFFRISASTVAPTPRKSRAGCRN